MSHQTNETTSNQQVFQFKLTLLSQYNINYVTVNWWSIIQNDKLHLLENKCFLLVYKPYIKVSTLMVFRWLLHGYDFETCVKHLSCLEIPEMLHYFTPFSEAIITCSLHQIKVMIKRSIHNSYFCMYLYVYFVFVVFVIINKAKNSTFI